MAYTRYEATTVSTPLSSIRRMCVEATMCLAVVGFAGLGSMSAQVAESPRAENPAASPAVDPMVQRNITDWAVQGKGVPDDWTHHHLVFSNPGTEQEAIKSGKYEHWLKVANDPRFTLQQMKRSGAASKLGSADVSAAVLPSATSAASTAFGRGPGTAGPQTNSKYAIKKDWNIPIGSAAGSAVGTVSNNNASGSPLSSVTINGTSISASAPTAASATGTITTNNASGSPLSTVTIDGQTLSATAPTTATGTGTIASNGAVGGTSTVTIDGQILTASAPVDATATGTISSNSATGSSSVTIDSVTLTASAPVLASGSGTISSNGAVGGTSTVTIDGQVLTASAPTAAVGTVQVNCTASTCNNYTITIGGTTYSVRTTLSGGTANQVLDGGSGTGGHLTTATNLRAAMLNDSTQCSGTCFRNVGGVNATVAPGAAANPLTLTAKTAGTGGNSIVLSDTGCVSGCSGTGVSQVSLNTTNASNNTTSTTLGADTGGGSQTGTLGTDGTASATTFPYWSGAAAVTPGQLATNIAATIAANGTLSPLITAAGSGSGTGTLTLTAKAGGTNGDYAYSASMPGFTWTGTGMTNGSCGTSSATTFTYNTGTASCTADTPGQLAGSIATAITANPTLSPLMTAVGSGTTPGILTLTAKAVGTTPNGYGTTATTFTGFTWGGGTFSGGSCGANTTSLFAYNTGTTSCTADTPGQLATSIATSIADNGVLNPLITAAGSGTTPGTLTLTAKAAGSSGDYAYTASMPGFTWTGVGMTGGTDGAAASGTIFQYWSGAAAVSTTQLATNIAAAITANGTLGPLVSAVGSSSGSNGVVTVTAKTAGTAANSYATTAANFAGFSWGGADMIGGTYGTQSGTGFVYTSSGGALSNALVAANIAASINANGTLAPEVSAVASTSGSNGIVTVTADTTGATGDYSTGVANFSGFLWSGNMAGGAAGARVQPNMYPAKYSFSSTSSSCTDFVVYPTGTQGAAGAASIVAFNNLYAGTGACITAGANAPVVWAYNTGGMATTSPVLSGDGTQVTFIQVTGTTASLVVLKPAAGGTPTQPVTPTAETTSTYNGCTAPCMVVLPFANSANVTYSAPFYSYGLDSVYVGDDSGNLHRFTGVFTENPQEAVSPWPVHVGSAKLSSPVYDNASGNVIFGDFGGVLHSVSATTGAIVGTSVVIGDAIADAPLVDSSTSEVYAFVTTGSAAYFPGSNTVHQFYNGFGAGATPQGVLAVGTGGAGYYLYSGTFDNVYYTNGPTEGSIYVVGNTGVTTGAALYRIAFNNGGIGSPTAVVAGLNSTFHPFPSPVTEFCNNGTSDCTANTTTTTAGTDLIFFSVNSSAKTGCTAGAGHGCVLAYNVNSITATPTEVGSGLPVTTPVTNGCWATSGISVDNALATAGNSQLYFIELGTNAAGGAVTGATGQTSANCTTGAATTIGATQTSQTNP